ncbi:uncharacterized protein LOC119669296 [Teleopsis dalmanni]|uniref:uncharacterized protein LOC119669296 n=1 Tax=Teleopsis dalmanni TaxID=139649 RepID=UPI0018CF5BE8|nr:uncharacterized protein LOC119669296 [Teleopsis dalmanni]
MDELSECTSEVIEFLPTTPLGSKVLYLDKGTSTDINPKYVNKSTETFVSNDEGTQTQTGVTSVSTSTIDDEKLASWLQKILPGVENELRKGATPLSQVHANRYEEDLKIEPYQKISIENITENSQGLAIWLSIHTNNAPMLAVTSVAPHDDWCEHIEQSITIFVPQRIKTDYVVFNKMKSVPVDACLKCLSTNPYNKNIFAGSTYNGEIYVWKCQHDSNSKTLEVQQLFKVTSQNGSAVGIEWTSPNSLFTAHANGNVLQWFTGEEMVKSNQWLNILQSNGTTEITTILCLSPENFVIGTSDGNIYNCFNETLRTGQKVLKIMKLKNHQFAVTTLLKGTLPGDSYVISCDMSGELYFHDIKIEEKTDNIIKIPLPFKNVIASSRDGNVIYSPGTDGSLVYYRKSDGRYKEIKGALRGKGNTIKLTNNGYWIVTGLYGCDFQLFYLED